MEWRSGRLRQALHLAPVHMDESYNWQAFCFRDREAGLGDGQMAQSVKRLPGKLEEPSF